jgi:hypothetical protein
VVCIALAVSTALVSARQGVPTARLVAAPRLALPGAIDSNNPVVWDLEDGADRMFVMTSWGGTPSLSIGSGLADLRPGQPVTFTSHPGHGVWMEAVIRADDGSWYGYYHHETPADACGRPDRFIPRLGAARSVDRGRSWDDLGMILEAPPDSHACGSTNRFVLGGVGDVTVVLDASRQDVYLFFSQYGKEISSQGVGAARMAWADRDAPVGRVAVWSQGAWLPAQVSTESAAVEYPVGTALVPPSRPWHDGQPAADVFWGPAVHWNRYLEQYVMLVNRARDETFNQDGIYVSFSSRLDDPRLWSAPSKVMNEGQWYAQVIGTDPGDTDKVAGRRARFFNLGRSDHVIEFER